MALTYTPVGELGSPCPPFRLPTVTGSQFGLEDCRQAQVLLVMFICAHCPYVQAIEERLINLGNSYPPSQVQVVAICSNDWSDHPEDSPVNLLRRWQEKNYGFPYLLDEDQSVAKKFGAVCTPDFFLFDQQRKLAYRGRLDDSWKNPALVKQQDLRLAIDLLLQGKSLTNEQIPSMGCSIKWKK